MNEKEASRRMTVSREKRGILLLALAAIVLTLIPYLIGATMSAGRHFMWLGYNLDDCCVYLSWMRQAADGSARAMNLFTTEPQQGMAFNPLFLALGRFARLTGLPLLATFHAARLLFGFLLIWAVWRFACLTIVDSQARRFGILILCFASGLGWLPFWWDAAPINTPIDKWQPEAITFLSLYLSPLFVFSLLLQVSVFGFLLQAERRGQARYAVLAGICGFLLGLVHTYDVISVSAVWIVYLLSHTVRPQPQSPVPLLQRWIFALLAGSLAAPSVLYIYIQYRTEEVFRARADVATLSAAFYWVLLGYGLTLALALVAVRALKRSTASSQNAPDTSGSSTSETSCSSWTYDNASARLLLIWGLVNILVSYLPGLAFQRKLLQGAHIPMALLAGIGTVSLQRTASASLQRSVLTMPLLLFILSLTNIRFVVRDIANYAANRSQTMQQRPFLEKGEIEALLWVKENTPSDTAIQPLPWVLYTEMEGRSRFGVYDSSLACFAPGLIHRKVYCGHWGETPDFGAKLNALSRFAHPMTEDTERRSLLRTMKVEYLLFSQLRQADPMDNKSAEKIAPMFRGLTEMPEYLVKVYGNPDAEVYRVLLDKLAD